MKNFDVELGWTSQNNLHNRTSPGLHRSPPAQKAEMTVVFYLTVEVFFSFLKKLFF